MRQVAGESVNVVDRPIAILATAIRRTRRVHDTYGTGRTTPLYSFVGLIEWLGGNCSECPRPLVPRSQRTTGERSSMPVRVKQVLPSEPSFLTLRGEDYVSSSQLH